MVKRRVLLPIARRDVRAARARAGARGADLAGRRVARRRRGRDGRTGRRRDRRPTATRSPCGSRAPDRRRGSRRLPPARRAVGRAGEPRRRAQRAVGAAARRACSRTAEFVAVWVADNDRQPCSAGRAGRAGGGWSDAEHDRHLGALLRHRLAAGERGRDGDRVLDRRRLRRDLRPSSRAPTRSAPQERARPPGRRLRAGGRRQRGRGRGRGFARSEADCVRRPAAGRRGGTVGRPTSRWPTSPRATSSTASAVTANPDSLATRSVWAETAQPRGDRRRPGRVLQQRSPRRATRGRGPPRGSSRTFRRHRPAAGGCVDVATRRERQRSWPLWQQGGSDGRQRCAPAPATPGSAPETAGTAPARSAAVRRDHRRRRARRRLATRVPTRRRRDAARTARAGAWHPVELTGGRPGRLGAGTSSSATSPPTARATR